MSEEPDALAGCGTPWDENRDKEIERLHGEVARLSNELVNHKMAFETSDRDNRWLKQIIQNLSLGIARGSCS